MDIPKITGKITGGERAVEQVQSFAGHLRDELRTSVSRLGQALLLRVKQKLSGEVLKAPTGNLKGSMNERLEESGDSIMAIVGTSLGRVPYARIHEYGGIITPKRGEFLTFKTADGSWHRVRQVVMPERSYLRSSLAELRPTVAQEVQNACRRAARASGLKSA